MVTKSRKANAGKKKKIKVLSLKKETVKDLTSHREKRVKGGLAYYYNSATALEGTLGSKVISSARPSGATVSG